MYIQLNKKQPKLWLAYLTLSVGLSASTLSHADDAKLYPGSYCKTTYEGGLVDASNGDPTQLQNTSTSQSLFMTCPIIRDYMASDSGIKNVQVRYFNNNDAKTVSCNVDIRHRDGSYVARASARTNYGDRSGVLTLNLNREAGVFRSYVLTCWLPPSFSNTSFPKIESYRVVEFD